MPRENPKTQFMHLIGWLRQSQVTRFDLAVGRRHPSGEKSAFLAPSTTKAENLTPTQVETRLPWLRAENAAGADIYFRPYRHQSWPLVFLDDLSPNVARKIAAKYRAAVIETSSRRCHLWLHMTRPLDETQRYEIQKTLVQRLEGEADPGSVSGEHWGRLPGFRNRKPGRNCWVNLLFLSHRPSCHPPEVMIHPCNRKASPTPDSEVATIDHSRMEWGQVMGALEKGVPPQQVLAWLIEQAQARRGQKDGLRYARYTVQKACRILGIPGP